jgi:hypothetical protein
MADLAWSTRVTYRGYLDRTILPALGHLPLRRLDTATLDRFYTGPASPDGAHTSSKQGGRRFESRQSTTRTRLVSKQPCPHVDQGRTAQLPSVRLGQLVPLGGLS